MSAGIPNSLRITRVISGQGRDALGAAAWWCLRVPNGTNPEALSARFKFLLGGALPYSALKEHPLVSLLEAKGVLAASTADLSWA